MDIIKKILEYLLMTVPGSLKEQKVAITSVRQRYESTESQHGYKTGTETTFGERGAPIDIGKSKDNFNKNGKLRYFNYNICEHMAKKY